MIFWGLVGLAAMLIVCGILSLYAQIAEKTPRSPGQKIGGMLIAFGFMLIGLSFPFIFTEFQPALAAKIDFNPNKSYESIALLTVFFGILLFISGWLIAAKSKAA